MTASMRLEIPNQRIAWRVALLVLGIVYASLPAAQAGEPIVDPSFVERIASIHRMREEGRTTFAENQARALLAEAELVHGPRSAEAAASLDALVQCLPYGPNAKAPASRLLAQRAVELKRKLYGRDDARVAESLTNMAVLLEETGALRQACNLYEQALRITEKALGRDQPESVPILKNMADARGRLGDYAGAARDYERAEAILRGASNPDALALSDVLNGRAIVAYQTGNYIQARDCWQQAIDRRIMRYGSDHPRVASLQYNLALLLKDMHDDAAAKKLVEHALDIHLRSLDDPENVLIGMDKLVLAELEKRSGNLLAAKQLFENALSIFRSRRGEDDERVAMCLHGLGTVNMELGQHEKARPALEQALVIRTKCLPEDHYLIGYTMRWLARLHYEVGRIDLARQLCERALLIYERALGPQHRELAEVLALRGALLYEAGDAAGALANALRAEAIGAAHLRLIAQGVEERESLLYARIRPRGLDIALQVVIDDPSNYSAARRAWDAVIHSRALVFDQLAARSKAAALAPVAETARILTDLRLAASQVSNLTLRGTGDAPEQHAALLADARRRKAAAERALADRSRFSRDELATPIGFDAVRAKLPRDCVLVAFSAYTRTTRAAAATTEKPSTTLTRVRHLMAFVLARDQRIQAIPLGPEHEIETSVARWVEEVAFGTRIPNRTPAQAMAACFAAGDSLRRLVWDPIEPLLRDAQFVLVVPEGALHQLNFAALPATADRYLIDAGWRLHSLSAERDVVSFSGSHRPGKAFLVVGGVDFDALPATQAQIAGASLASSTVGGSESRPTLASSTRSAQLPCRGIEGWLLEPLPESLREVDDLFEILSRARTARNSLRHEATRLTGAEASEEAVKATAEGKYWLHLATHGFVLGSDCQIPVPEAREIRVPSPVGRPDREPANPLLLAGLALAGAAYRNQAPGEHEDGILTAEEVVCLNLQGVECVVLSSCKTGVGPVESSEGVLSLCRAFRIAGARTLVMSLWSVSDAHTRSWMRAFYSSSLEDGLDVVDAAYAANVTVLASLRRAGASAHPYYWGGFVTTGAWN